MGVPEGASWGPKKMEPFGREEEKQMRVSLHRGEQPPMLHRAHNSPPGCREVQFMHRVYI